jgi:TrmH RNA methyltransferase
MNPKTITLCGLPAVKARWETNPESFRRLFFDPAMGRKVPEMSKALAAAKKIYRCVEAEELQRVAGSVHHGGIVAIVMAPRMEAPRRTDPAAWAEAKENVIILDRIGNAHNLGAIARTAAFYGIKHIIIPDTDTAAQPNSAAYRVAEGGLEYIQIWTPSNLGALARDMVELGYEVVGAATRGGPDALKEMRDDAPVALVMGNEESGLSRELEKACTRLVTLEGTKHVESLNVSVAAAILMDRLFRR